MNSVTLPESTELWLSKECDSNPWIHVTLPHVQGIVPLCPVHRNNSLVLRISCGEQ